MDIPTHLNPLSLPVLLLGLLIIFKYKSIANVIYSSYSKKFETFMGGQFKENYVNGYGKTLSVISTIFLGFVLLLVAFSISFGPITAL